MAGTALTSVADPPPRGVPTWARLRDARISAKLGLILVIPLIATIALATARLVEGGRQAIEADMVQSLAAVSVQAAAASHELHRERVEAARLLSEPDRDPGAFTHQASRTDEVVGAYQVSRSQIGAVPEIVETRLATIDEHLAGLNTLRGQVLGAPPITASATILRYGAILTDVLAYQEALGGAIQDPTLSEEVRAVAALSAARAHAADAEALAQLIDEGRLADEHLGTFLATQVGQREAFQAFRQAANPQQRAAVDQAITGGNVAFAEAGAAALLQPGDQPTFQASSFAGMVDITRHTEAQLQQRLLASATQVRDDVFQQVLFESVAVLLALVVAIAVAVLLARMLARSLGRLRENALAVADRELPATVARLSDPRTLGENTPAQLAAQVREPIELRSRDEIGQVAQAFNVVHRAAVRVAAEQAALRTSVSAMFLNLARRSQSLVDRMISQLDEIERNEEDPKRLSRMFVLDHLATRMRRNDENLLVLAGADSSPPRRADAQVVDVLRAAQSEVEHYDRIEFGTVDADVSVVANAVNDVVRLVAELFDNATRFSPPESAVVCEARRLGDQMIIQIEDRGVGMSQDQVGRLNAWLATPPAVEVTTFRKMGLAVVARLASRQQIRVELRCDPSYGTIAYVALPRSALLLPPSRLRQTQIPHPRLPAPTEAATGAGPPDPAAPLVASRHPQLPRRSPAVTHHAAARHGRYAQQNTPLPGGQGGSAAASRPWQQLTALPAVVPAAAREPQVAQPTGPPETNSTVELPIFQAMEQVWFHSHGQQGPRPDTQIPRAGAYPEPPMVAEVAPIPIAGRPPMPPPAPPATAGEPADRSLPDPRDDHEATGRWRTAADNGWQAAAAAEQPHPGGATSSGLPKRVPQAQLVPGGVANPQPVTTHKSRSPEEVRGLLSAYHRGVQRGRETRPH